MTEGQVALEKLLIRRAQRIRGMRQWEEKTGMPSLRQLRHVYHQKETTVTTEPS